MTLPSFLIHELRTTFRACACKPSSTSIRYISSGPALRARVAKPSRAPSSSSRPTPAKSPALTSNLPARTTQETKPAQSTASTELTTRDGDKTSLDTERRVPVPMKIIPKANITPNLTLNPKERLHVEMLTRMNPKVVEEKKIYRERIQIYHSGHARENVMAILKVSTIVCACATTFIIAPAHLAAGSSWLLVAGLFFGGFVPITLVNYYTAPMVSRIFLKLPPPARDSAKAAMDYAKNIPKSAELDIHYLRPWALEGKITARVSEFEPAKPAFFRPLSFTWSPRYAKKGTTFSPVPTNFFVHPHSATGKAARDTTPRIWEKVYRVLTGVEPASVSRWRS